MAETGTNRTALVTGGSRGIGRAIALRLARDGLDVAITDVSANQPGLDEVAGEIRKLGRRSATFTGDVSVEADMQAVVEGTASALGKLDVLVANAGIAQVISLLEMSIEDWDKVLAVNLRGVFVSYRTAARQMIKQGHGGKIIGAGSIVSYRPFALLGHYSASKFAVRGLTQAAALEWAKYGITVNAYCPGIVGTAMWDLIDEKLAAEEGLQRGEALKKYAQAIPLGRVSEPEDVAKFVSYLASSDSDYMTGQSVMIDGGIQFS